MPWKQLIEPNDDPYYPTSDGNAWMGWCLAVCAESFAQGNPKQSRLYRSNTALIESGKVDLHKDKNLPVGVWTPIWWNGFGGLGHSMRVKINADGTCDWWSSPKTRKWTADGGRAKNLEECLGTIWDGWGKSGDYIGWSDNICGLKVLDWVEDPKPVEPTPAPQPTPEPVVPQPEPEPTPEPETPTTPPNEPTDDTQKQEEETKEEKEDEMSEPEQKQDMSIEEQEQLLSKVEEATQKIADLGESEIAQEISAKAPYWLKVTLYVLVDLLLTASAIIPQVLILLNSTELSVKGMMMATMPATLAGAIQLSFKFLRKVSK